MNRAGFMKGGSEIATCGYARKRTPRAGHGLIHNKDADISSVRVN
jgi:hypothetical protein